MIRRRSLAAAAALLAIGCGSEEAKSPAKTPPAPSATPPAATLPEKPAAPAVTLESLAVTLPAGCSKTYQKDGDWWLFEKKLADGRTAVARIRPAPPSMARSAQAYVDGKLAGAWDKGTRAAIRSQKELPDGFAATVQVTAAADPKHPKEEFHAVWSAGGSALHCECEWLPDPATAAEVAALCTSAAPAALPVDSSVQVGEATLQVRSIGGSPTSPALVVVAGGWGLSHEYLRGLDALATPALRVVYFDHRGVGRSTASAGPLTFDRLVEDVEAVRASLGLERVHLLGHSAGGLTALGYAMAHPERVEKLLLIDGISPGRKPFGDGMRRFHERIGALAKQGIIRPNESGDATAFLTSILPIYFVDTAHPGSRSLGGATFRNEVFDAIDKSLGDFDYSGKLKALPMPVFVFAAETPFGSMGSAVLSSLRADRVSKLVVTDCGHLPWIECPGRFLPAVASFLSGG